jgi:hypothetical protein
VDHACMAGISVEDVLRAVQDLDLVSGTNSPEPKSTPVTV